MTTNTRQVTTTTASIYRHNWAQTALGRFSLGQKIWRCWWLSGFFSVAAWAQDWQPLVTEQIHQGIASLWGPAAPTVTVTFPDAGLHPPACEAWSIELPSGSRLLGRLSVRLRCPASGWSGWLPVMIHGEADVLITRVALQRGETLTADKLSLVRQDVTTESRPWYSDPATVSGATTRRPLAAGTLIQPGLISPPRLVSRGDLVTLESGDGTITVRDQGIAQADGSSGDRVRVRNSHSRQEVDGIVVAPGLVRVD